ncbi:hypothetical protein [Motiliproteus sp. SC1-56]|uniref:hypothetical protein n=1 Tax=Motiliproteus sp. SC1-56 TaxID=2799565 RepID=UPI001A8F3E0A|nr:hypothetical protein [Motiliproteus sp. SC1-56]
MRQAFVLVTAMTLTGCGGLPVVHPGELILDTERQLLCLDAEINCRGLGLIVASADRDKILAAYGQPLWEWSALDSVAELSQLLREPPDQAYQAQQIAPGLYRLPVTPATRTVWELLDAEYRDRYCDPGERFGC